MGGRNTWEGEESSVSTETMCRRIMFLSTILVLAVGGSFWFVGLEWVALAVWLENEHQRTRVRRLGLL